MQNMAKRKPKTTLQLAITLLETADLRMRLLEDLPDRQAQVDSLKQELAQARDMVIFVLDEIE
jgi:hypothetical protein